MKNTDFVTVVYQVSDWDAFKKTWINGKARYDRAPACRFEWN